jgi:hypothetical protein
MLDRVFQFFASLKLTVACLALSVLLVFVGTLAQVNQGLYQAQERYFRSFFVWWGPPGADWQIPISPGGYLVGGVLVLSLVAGHLKRFKFAPAKLGIFLAHIGLILLLLGQLATDLLSKESLLQLREGQTKNYSDSHQENELVFITDAAQAGFDRVISIPESYLAAGDEIRHPSLPFSVRVKRYYINSRLRERASATSQEPPVANQGVGPQVTLHPLLATKKTDERNFPSAVLELAGPQGALGTWLVSSWLTQPQEISGLEQPWRLALRWKRFYTPYSIQLLKATHEVYRGTDIPKNFQSRVRIENPVSGENREVDIYMNNPLRYEGLTYYQYQMGPDERDARVGTSTLQVVRNPSWLTPYLGCVLVGAGLVIQFMKHLLSFLHQRRTA